MSDPLFQQMLVPIDGSESSVEAAQLAFRVAHALCARVTLLYVVDTVVMREVMRFANHQPADVHEEFRKSGREYLRHLEELAHQANLAVRREIREGEPHEEIVALADELGADLIVMGHVGRRGPRRILIGSVTERVIEQAHCPVLVVKNTAP